MSWLHIKEYVLVIYCCVSKPLQNLAPWSQKSCRFTCLCFCSLDWTYILVLLLGFFMLLQLCRGLTHMAASQWKSLVGRGASWAFLHVDSHLSVVHHGHFSNLTHTEYLISLVALIIMLFLWGKAKLYYFIFTSIVFSRKNSDLP